MKIFKMFALAAVVLFTVACGKDNNNPGTTGGNNTEIAGFDAIEKEWKLISVDGVANDFSVYISFTDGIFFLYQQVYSWDYVLYEGQYTIDGGVLNGTYVDGSSWKTPYTGGVSEDGQYLILKSKEATPVTYMYEACTIPDEVFDEATGTRAEEIVPFL